MLNTFRIMPLLLAPDPPAGGGGGAGGGGAPQTVDYATYQAAVTAKNAADAEVARLKGDLTKATERGATVDALTGQVTELQGKVAKSEGRFAMFTEFSGLLGTTDTDVIDTFNSKYEALPEKDRPARGDWLKGLREKPDAAPALLRPFLGAQPGGAGGPPPKPPQPKVPGTPPTPPGAPSSLSKEEIKKIREDAIRTGDWSKWKAHRKSLGLEK